MTDTVADVLREKVEKVTAYKTPDGWLHHTAEKAVAHLVAQHPAERRSARLHGLMALGLLVVLIVSVFSGVLP